MVSTQSFKKFQLVGSLYISQFVPFWFLYQALPILLRQKGASLEAIGFLPLLLLPVSLKFLWAPLIDFYGFTRWGHYRFWIICFQLWVVGTTIFCSVLSVETNLPLLLMGLVFIAIGSSSQDIATDALALGLFKPEERGVGNAIQGIGGAVGRAIGGGGMLILLNRWGWTTSLLILAIIMLVALVPLLFHREKIPSNSRKVSPKITSLNPKRTIEYFKIFIDICQRPGMKIWLVVLALATSGYNLSATMFRPLLVDIGLSLEEIGWLIGIFGMMMTILGSLAASWTIACLGRKKSFLIAISLTAIGTLANLLLTFEFTQPIVLYLIVSITLFSIGMTGTTTFTIMMDKSRQEMGGTDYTLQTSVIPIFSILSAVLSGLIAEKFGYQSLFLLSSIIILIGFFLVSKYFHIVEFD
ncbi:MFS transporter [Oscillatoriales cyanobacterium LEGE 11467]|uniref:MFS transporter n=1 Tax=Zarconia navalis LEGE 11467 TaxID=1828826 RepID=A0A928VW83_9CYAN|nr:MFS transporter [Zarconia navalis]MBE9040679.1 MFS transporter [Zarconia navalis LEGE 11467]